MGRTNIEIDERLIQSVMKRYGLRSKRAAVELALRRLAGESLTKAEVLGLEGSGWEGDLKKVRASRVAPTR